MTRRFVLPAVVGFVLAGLPVLAQDRKQPPDPTNPVKGSTVELYGMNANLDLAGGAPSVRVVQTEADYKALAKLWNIRNAPDVDFKREFLVVVTSRSGKVIVQTKLTDDGDLRVSGLENDDAQAGFRYGIKSIRRDGVKTVNGRPFPPVKE